MKLPLEQVLEVFNKVRQQAEESMPCLDQTDRLCDGSLRLWPPCG
jgi:hypothetical protein